MATPTTPSRLRSISLIVDPSLVHSGFCLSTAAFWEFALVCAEAIFVSSRHSNVSEPNICFTYAPLWGAESTAPACAQSGPRHSCTTLGLAASGLDQLQGLKPKDKATYNTIEDSPVCRV